MIVILVLCFFLFLNPGGAAAQEPAPAPGPPPEAVKELVQLLKDPAVAAWLQQAEAAGTPAAAALAPTEAEVAKERIESDLSRHIGRARDHLRSMVAAAPRFKVQAERAIDDLRRERAERPPGSTLALFVIFLGVASLAEFLFRRALGGRLTGGRSAPDAGERAGAAGVQLMVSLLAVAIFAVASVGPFLLIEWPPLLKDLALHILAAIILVRFALAILRAIFAAARQNAGEESDARDAVAAEAAAKFWWRYTATFVCYFACGWTILQLMPALGFSADVRQLAGYILAIGLVLIALVAIWRRPRRHAAAEPRWRRAAMGILLTGYVLAMWVLWVAELRGLLWIGLLAFILPRAIAFSHATVSRLLTPKSAVATPTVRRALLEVAVDRGLRALLIVAAALWLAHVADVDVAGLASDETPLSRLFGGILTSVVIFLAADFAWQLIRSGLDAKVAAASPAETGTAKAVREARLRTLIPIFRNIIFIVIAVFAVLMALAAFGVQIAPLIAGAGVLGVAIGFGAQNLVKDIISGMFYLVDDAFRVGEYIQSGSYKGTVEGFSLRSIRLRHQNGPVFVIPFSELGAVENMSRDWVIDKFSVGITYDSDIEKARKLIKQVGQNLSQEPSFAKSILEPLKMQGVDQLGDFAVVLRCKMKTRPGEQFMIRRKALAMIKKTFDENGIKFAFPTVQVAGGDTNPAPAVAREALELIRPAAAT